MAYCKNCGNEVSGNFCQGCGTAVADTVTNTSSSNGGVVYNNATIKARYKTRHITATAYLGVFWLIFTVVGFIFLGVGLKSGEIIDGIGIFLLCIVVGAVFIFFPIRSGFKCIKKNTPKEEISDTRKAFLKKCVLAIPAFQVSLFCCLFVVGILLGAWRIVARVATPRDCDYTAFVGDEKIPVIRLVDYEYSTPDKIRYIYEDRNGNQYRESVF